jgi:hypothetical protein
MSTIRNEGLMKRNDKCSCGSDKKFKRCCSPEAPQHNSAAPQYHDSGEAAVRWVICDRAGTALFADKDNRALVFKNKEDAYAIAVLDEFSSQEPGDINVGAVGPTKWAHIQDQLLFVEIDDIETAAQLLRERIAAFNAARETKEQDSPPTSVEGPTNVE